MKPLHVSDWLHEPTAQELKRDNARLKSWLLALGAVALLGWAFFAGAVLVR